MQSALAQSKCLVSIWQPGDLPSVMAMWTQSEPSVPVFVSIKTGFVLVHFSAHHTLGFGDCSRRADVLSMWESFEALLVYTGH